MAHFSISDVLESFLGEHRKHNEDTGQISFDCPACSLDKGMPDGDGKGNLEVNYNLGKFRCWVCSETNQMHGNVTRLIKNYGTQTNLRDYLLLRPDQAASVSTEEREETVVTLPVGFKELSKCTSKDYKADLAKKYLYDRGITDDIIKDYGIGYTIRGKYFNRIIIPSYDASGKLNYFVGRWFVKEKPLNKYLNPDAEKSEIIFNEGKINFDSTIYLVEGATDHIVIPNSIPLLGKFIYPKLLEQLHDNAMAYIVVVLDDDAWEDAARLYKELNFGDLRGRIRIVKCPEGYDPSKVNEKLGGRGVAKLLMSARQLSERELY